ncbi:sulfotransferase domain-containing protein [Rhodovibrio salinarum]|uniref:Sulfotransferase domain-containing protein n=1 Tax=Rhodovibrio salinarum TaxID=1087 RepID=A0A934UZM3_9PROT|nr:sulfotransferase domain-containing protein [Rhodovibrio salinarum]MBK1696898.1 hypothetical protein [Rhodovibrio salinarum]
MPKIFWVASYPKSGNTWMRAFLANLLMAKEHPLSLNEIGEACASEANIAWYLPLLKGHQSSLEDLSHPEIMELRPKAQKRITEVNKNDVFIKTHNLHGLLHDKPLIRDDLTLGFLYIIRDPRDVVISGADHWGVTIDEMLDCMAEPTAETAPMPGRQVFEKLGTWSMHVDSWMSGETRKRLSVRYEDLLRDPIKYFTKIGMGLGLSKDRARIQQVVEWTSFSKLREMESQEDFVERSVNSERFFRSGKAGGWRKQLSPKQVARIERDHGEVMRRFGYL